MGLFDWNPFTAPLRSAVGSVTGNRWLGGQEGYLPDIKLPTVPNPWSSEFLTRKDGGKTSFKALYSPEGYAEGAGLIRGAIMKRGTASAEGLIGAGAVEWLGGRQGLYPNWFPGGEAGGLLGAGGGGDSALKIIKDPAQAAKDVIPQWMQSKPDWWTKNPLAGVIPEGFGDMSGIGEGVGAGIAGMGASLGSALSGISPKLPGLPTVGGESNMSNIALLAAVAVGGVYLISRGKK